MFRKRLLKKVLQQVPSPSLSILSDRAGRVVELAQIWEEPRGVVLV
jgi:hypothetical protein